MKRFFAVLASIAAIVVAALWLSLQYQLRVMNENLNIDQLSQPIEFRRSSFCYSEPCPFDGTQA